jgi:hypothetical protein
LGTECPGRMLPAPQKGPKALSRGLEAKATKFKQ